jgi:D-alanine-D-alanine ligase
MSDSGIWAVVFGGPSPEHEISILTGLQAERVLTDAGHTIAPIYVAPTGAWFLVPSGTEAKDYLEGAPAKSSELEVKVGDSPGFFQKKGLSTKQLDISAALLCFHGGLGEGGGAAALFELLDIPATGSSLYAGAVGMDKLAFAGLMMNAEIPSLPRQHLSAETEPGFPGPYIVKPRFGGSSIGIEIVDDLATARAVMSSSPHLKNGAVIEPYRKGIVDLNISFRTFPDFELTDVEKPLRDGESSGMYSYQEKYLSGSGGGAGLTHAPREFPAQVPDTVNEQARSLAHRVAEVTRLSGIVRVDLLWDPNDDRVYVNEVNTIPGAMSLYLWSPKRPPAEVLSDAINEAIQRRIRWPQAGFSQGVALKAAGGIAGKLLGMSGN